MTRCVSSPHQSIVGIANLSLVFQLFSRIMQSVNRKQKYEYKLSYHQDVGSSYDPELEDISQWESELRGT